MNTSFESGNIVVKRKTGFMLADTDTIHESMSDVNDGVRLQISQQIRLRQENHNTVWVPSNVVSLTLSVDEIDSLIERLTLAKSLIGSDFLIFDHVNEYSKDDVQYDFDGKVIPEKN